MSNRHILISASLLEDYVHLLSKLAFYISQKKWTFPMHSLKWEFMFNPEEETFTTIAWIFFLSLSPKFWGKESVFFVAAAVEKPLQMDMTIKNQTRPSCARIEVQANLLRDFSKRIKIGIKKAGGEVLKKWIKTFQNIARSPWFKVMISNNAM